MKVCCTWSLSSSSSEDSQGAWWSVSPSLSVSSLARTLPLILEVPSSSLLSHFSSARLLCPSTHLYLYPTDNQYSYSLSIYLQSICVSSIYLFISLSFICLDISAVRVSVWIPGFPRVFVFLFKPLDLLHVDIDSFVPSSCVHVREKRSSLPLSLHLFHQSDMNHFIVVDIHVSLCLSLLSLSLCVYNGVASPAYPVQNLLFLFFFFLSSSFFSSSSSSDLFSSFSLYPVSFFPSQSFFLSFCLSISLSFFLFFSVLQAGRSTFRSWCWWWDSQPMKPQRLAKLSCSADR